MPARYGVQSNGRMKRLLLLLLLAVSSMAHAQDDDIYRLDLGAGVGLCTYEGDFNSSILSGMKPMGQIAARYVVNPHSAFRLAVAYGQLGVDTSKEAGYNYYRDHVLGGKDISFSRSLFDVGVRYEYNFWAYGTGREYRGAKPLAPYLSLGLGICSASGGGYDLESATSLDLCFGFGVKYKVIPRLNLIAEWSASFAATDRLDGIADPQAIKSSGLFKNTDCFTTLQVGLSYDLWAKCRVCNKAE